MFSTSCIRSARTPEGSSDSSNDFKVIELIGISKSQSQNEVWRLPTQKIYEYNVCLLSRSSNAALPAGQAFKITRPDSKKVEKVKTDNLGCLSWTESLPFNYSADSIYVEKHRKLIGQGNYRGEHILHFAVNPWLSAEEVIDLNRQSLPEHLLAKEESQDLVLSGLANRNKSKKLLIESNPSLKILPVKDTAQGKEIKIILRLKPYFESLNMLGEPKTTQLRFGKFRVFAQLVGNYVGKDAASHFVLTPQLQAQEVQVKNNGILSMTVNVSLNRRIDMGQVQLALKVVPLETPFKMEPYQGLHNIGSFDNLYSASSAIQVQGDLSNSTFNYSNFIERSANFEKLKKAHFASDLPPFFYSDFMPRFVRIGTGETSIRRTVIFRLKTQVTDSVTGKIIINQPFSVKLPSGKSQALTTNSSGYLRWFDEVSHLYYQPEQYFFPKYEITHTSSNRMDRFTIAINPWDSGWTFGTDATTRAIGDKYKEMGDQKVRRSLFMVDAFRYQTIRFRYVIDKFMTLNVKKAVVMALDPLVQRYTIEKGRSFEVLRDGIYLVKVGLVKYYIDPFQNSTRLVRDNKKHYLLRSSDGGDAQKGTYTTIIKKLVRVQAGRITTPLEFSMRDLRMMSIRSLR